MGDDIPDSDIILNIKRNYMNICTNKLKQRSWHLQNITELELVEEEGIQNLMACHNQVCHSLNYTQLFSKKAQYNAAKLLILGEAGIGKTILCMTIAEDWANGRLFQEFLFVLLVPLCQRSMIASVSSLLELLNQLGLFQGDSKSYSSLVRYLATHKNKILVIADEWDEFYESICHKKSFLYRLLFGNLFPTISTTVMITARHGTFPPHMLQHIDRLITVRGFDKDTIVKCVHSEFRYDTDEIGHFLGQLEDNMLIDNMCQVPLNLALICNLCQSFKRSLPNTVTALYKLILWNIAQTNVRECDKYESLVDLSSYRDLPEELQQSWWLLCDLAFRNIEILVRQKFLLTELEATRFLSTELQSISYFGFIKSIQKTGDSAVSCFCFLHPAIEEYLAALHLVRQREAVQLNFIELCTKNAHRHFTHLWQFYFGIHANENLLGIEKSDVVVQAVQMLSKLHSKTSDSNKCLHLCYYSFEANNKIINHEVVEALCKKKQSESVSVNFTNPHNSQDCIAMIHVIKGIDIECKLEINFQNCNLKEKVALSLASALSGASSCVQVKGLDLSGNKLGDSIMADFFQRSAAALFSLEKLFVCNCGIGAETIHAIANTLADSSSQSLVQLDLSFNLLSMSSLCILQHYLESHEFLVKLEILLVRGSLANDDINSLVCFINTLVAHCLCLRRLDLSANDLGKPGSTEISNIISKITSLRADFDLRLNPEYMSEVDNKFISAMQESIRKRGTIERTIAHGIIVGPGRSGKNTLMNRLIGIRPDPDSTSPSTGVMETVVKVEIKKLCTVATAVSNLKWQKLECEEEALELIMTTARDHSASHSEWEPTHKCIVQEQQMQGTVTNDSAKLETASSPNRPTLQTKSTNASETIDHDLENENKTKQRSTSNAIVYSSDLEPVNIFRRAVKLRHMDALREHLESSWSFYLTNTGGQIEFQEHLSLLACGPSIFFLTFPLHHDLRQPYEVQYECPNGQVKAYQSTGTLLEELQQTLATIDALNYTNEHDGNARMPKVFFIGTHKDKLPEMTAEETIEKIDKLLQMCVRQTKLYHNGSIQFAYPPKKLIFAANNLSTGDEVFQEIRSAVQQTVERKQYKDFSIKCPSSWLVFSLILRAKHELNQVLTFEKCFSIAKECGILNRRELSHALSFIHSRLGLVRYFNVEGLNELVVVDPQVLFDRITDLLVNTFISSHAEVNEIEDFQRGILPVEIVERINKKCSSGVQLPLTWLTKLLNYLRIAALFRDHDGEKYFFPSAICHAPKFRTNQPLSFDSLPRLLIGFESGFCPRGVPGALIKILMTNELNSKLSWELLPDRIFRNQVSFGIEAYGDINLKIFPTHLEIFLDDAEADDINATCMEARTRINDSMKVVAKQFNECGYYWGFYCTLDECQAHPHPAKIEYRGSSPSKIKCYNTHKRGRLPRNYEVYYNNMHALHLDNEIDFGNGVPKHLGQIADSMAEWEGRIADELGLTEADCASIKTKYPMDLTLQKREALNYWKKKLGSSGTYNKLIQVYDRAGYKSYADHVRRLVTVQNNTNDDGEHFHQSVFQPETYPLLKPLSPPPEFQSSEMSQSDEYLLIKSASAKNFPEGKMYPPIMLEPCKVSFVPMLRSGKHTDSLWREAEIIFGPQQIVLEAIVRSTSGSANLSHTGNDRAVIKPADLYLISNDKRNPATCEVVVGTVSQISYLLIKVEGKDSVVISLQQKTDAVSTETTGNYSIKKPVYLYLSDGITREPAVGELTAVDTVSGIRDFLIKVEGKDTGIIPLHQRIDAVLLKTISCLHPWGIAINHKDQLILVQSHGLEQAVPTHGVDVKGKDEVYYKVEIKEELKSNHNKNTQCIYRNRILVLSLQGDMIHSFGQKGDRGGEFNMPRGVVVDDEDNIYVVDKLNSRIQKFSPSGEHLISVGTKGHGALEFDWPKEIGIHPQTNNVYITEANNHRVQILKLDFTFISVIGAVDKEGKPKIGIGNGEFNSPFGVAFDKAGRVYIADSVNDRIQVFTESNEFIAWFGGRGQLGFPSAVCIDKNDMLYVTEFDNQRISVFKINDNNIMSTHSISHKRESDSLSTSLPIPPNDRDTYLPPSFVTTFGARTDQVPFCFGGIAVDKQGVVYVTDGGNDEVQLFCVQSYNYACKRFHHDTPGIDSSCHKSCD